MLDFVKKNKILFAGVAVIIAGFVWYGMSEKQGENSLLTSTSISSAATQTAVERELLNTLLELRSIRLDGEIFSDPAFNSLRDFTTDIVSEPIGRRNPFAPLEEPGVLVVPEENTGGDGGQ
ncbi:hypothetical protein COU13_01935 [Candidatus Kaiserbacteria bacterium CG10_big_fil_rev_8_21_14_0_10_43_70]|uniref:Uncharacterized protein n=1 Tax=Candidatus Kaiserbacteria bacterium CG10_big_fil_rev_8_21_14_0_10_43_70 TaxID=1974605 RepID=A0A2H0UIP6_9BACT|nr:MAG: hypothetical protein COU13_01935 [Candidatus Kaiserbacteria bacterium CG10_big_fil_rev_8_21_14_0_10_43_70]